MALARVVVNDGPVRHVAVAPLFWRIMAVNGLRVSVSTGCQPLAGTLDCPLAELASQEEHCASALAVWSLAGWVGVAVQPAPELRIDSAHGRAKGQDEYRRCWGELHGAGP